MRTGVQRRVRGAVPREVWRARHYGANSGARAVPSQLARAAGPLLAAAVLANASGPMLLPLALFGCGVASLLLYLSAVGAAAPGAPAQDAQQDRKAA